MRRLFRTPTTTVIHWLRGALGVLALCAAGAAAAAAAPGGNAADADDAPLEATQQVRALARAQSAVVGLRSVAIDDAPSARTLGKERSGSGVLIDDEGRLILTIGYLILEAEEVMVELDDGRAFPARAIAYDQASGFGLVESSTPLPRPAAPFGRSAEVVARQPLMIATGGRDGALSIARLVSSRPFTGYWEYHIESALFTAPPRADHSGAGLFNGDGELVGIGSLLVNNALGAAMPPHVGNMFVPVDLLLPILDEMRRTGTTAASSRAWIGVNCIEAGGAVRLTRITRDSPADAAGLRPGDVIVAIDGTPVQAVDAFYKRLWQGASPNREVRLEINRNGESRQITVQATDRRHVMRHARGI